MTKKEENVVQNLATASTDVYLCCDTNLLSCTHNNDIEGWSEYVDRIITDYPGELVVGPSSHNMAARTYN